MAVTTSAMFILLGLYVLPTKTHLWTTRGAMIEDYLQRTLRSVQPRRP